MKNSPHGHGYCTSLLHEVEELTPDIVLTIVIVGDGSGFAIASAEQVGMALAPLLLEVDLICSTSDGLAALKTQVSPGLGLSAVQSIPPPLALEKQVN